MKELKQYKRENGSILEETGHSFSGLIDLMNEYSNESILDNVLQELFDSQKELKALEKKQAYLIGSHKTLHMFLRTLQETMFPNMKKDHFTIVWYNSVVTVWFGLNEKGEKEVSKVEVKELNAVIS